MHIAVDLDDVVLDFVGGLRAAVKREYDVEITEDEIVSFDLKPILNPIIGRSWWAWMRDRSWIWAHFDAVDGAIGTIDRLRREGHYMELVTSKPEWAEHNVYRWLGKWRPAFQRVTITGPEDVKADQTEADVLVDDKVDNCLTWAATGRFALLFDRPHNRSAVFDPMWIVRVKDWHEVYKEIRRLSDET